MPAKTLPPITAEMAERSPEEFYKRVSELASIDPMPTRELPLAYTTWRAQRGNNRIVGYTTCGDGNGGLKRYWLI